jgi:hypothetical protein
MDHGLIAVVLRQFSAVKEEGLICVIAHAGKEKNDFLHVMISSDSSSSFGSGSFSLLFKLSDV